MWLSCWTLNNVRWSTTKLTIKTLPKNLQQLQKSSINENHSGETASFFLFLFCVATFSERNINKRLHWILTKIPQVCRKNYAAVWRFLYRYNMVVVVYIKKLVKTLERLRNHFKRKSKKVKLVLYVLWFCFIIIFFTYLRNFCLQPTDLI